MTSRVDNLLVTDITDNSPDLAPLGRRARKALAVRQALFNAGLDAFDRQPISLVSVLDITERADVAKGVFYLQFRSKDEYLLALWEDVQARFLDSARAKSATCRSKGARLEATAHALLDFMYTSPSAARFWLRMASYFPDEIGEPGHLMRIHQAYVRQIATLISGNTERNLSDHDMLTAQLVDSMGWAVINAEFQTGKALLDSKRLVKAIKAMLVPSVAK